MASYMNKAMTNSTGHEEAATAHSNHDRRTGTILAEPKVELNKNDPVRFTMATQYPLNPDLHVY